MLDLLIVEDDLMLQNLINDYIEINFPNVFQIYLFSDYENSIRFLNKCNTNFAILDISLQNSFNNGLDIAKYIRKKEESNNLERSPIIIITGQNDTDIEINAFNNKVSLFHKKPINFSLLKSQINSFIIKQNSIRIDKNKNIAIFQSGQINLTPKEMIIFEKLLINNGKVIRRIDLAELANIGGFETTVNTIVSRIRNKLKLKNINIQIISKYSKGYYLHIPQNRKP